MCVYLIITTPVIRCRRIFSRRVRQNRTLAGNDRTDKNNNNNNTSNKTYIGIYVRSRRILRYSQHHIILYAGPQKRANEKNMGIKKKKITPVNYFRPRASGRYLFSCTHMVRDWWRRRRLARYCAPPIDRHHRSRRRRRREGRRPFRISVRTSL